jgi:hypothetical protein
LVSGLAAALVGWLGGEAVQGYHKPEMRMVMDVQRLVPGTTAETENAATVKNSRLAIAIFGGAMGLALGVAGGIASHSVWRTVLVGVVGAGAAVAVGLLGARYGLHSYYARLVPDPNDYLTPIRVHAAIWGGLGAVGGLAFGLGFGSLRRLPLAVVGAGVGALLATALFHVLGGLVLEEAQVTDPVATSSLVRLVSYMLVALLTAAGAAGGALGSRSAPAPSATFPEGGS